MFRVEQQLVPHGELDVPPTSVQQYVAATVALVLTSLQQRAHLCSHPAHQRPGGFSAHLGSHPAHQMRSCLA